MILVLFIGESTVALKQQNFTKKFRVTLKEYKTSKAVFIHGNKGQLVHELSL